MFVYKFGAPSTGPIDPATVASMLANVELSEAADKFMNIIMKSGTTPALQANPPNSGQELLLERLEERLQEMESRIMQNINEKFDQMLQKQGEQIQMLINTFTGQ